MNFYNLLAGAPKHAQTHPRRGPQKSRQRHPTERYKFHQNNTTKKKKIMHRPQSSRSLDGDKKIKIKLLLPLRSCCERVLHRETPAPRERKNTGTGSGRPASEARVHGLDRISLDHHHRRRRQKKKTALLILVGKTKNRTTQNLETPANLTVIGK